MNAHEIAISRELAAIEKRMKEMVYMSETKQPDAFDGQPFYTLMQQYRCGPALPLSRTIDAFESVKGFARTELATLREERDALLVALNGLLDVVDGKYSHDPQPELNHGIEEMGLIKAARAAIAKVAK